VRCDGCTIFGRSGMTRPTTEFGFSFDRIVPAGCRGLRPASIFPPPVRSTSRGGWRGRSRGGDEDLRGKHSDHRATVHGHGRGCRRLRAGGPLGRESGAIPNTKPIAPGRSHSPIHANERSTKEDCRRSARGGRRGAMEVASFSFEFPVCLPRREGTGRAHPWSAAAAVPDLRVFVRRAQPLTACVRIPASNLSHPGRIRGRMG